ncbi:EmrB/QacA subfamily drug resistance transporter [Actinoplanes tereljensis]|uniref:DHA2 family efflux MFS transporter permease subunit n=1 Tax=Paractinoplanes tereljensis TaxID=571912 RepID=UPI0019407613|nr:DHA2 family efflux MFS transporter permease subunit [Actinoplanes tereljensis]
MTRSARWLALLVAGAYFMEFLDATVIAPAAPHIAADLGVAPVTVNVTITAYVLTIAVLIPISGWLTERFGARRVFAVAIAVFTLASAGCAVAVNLPMLVGTRVLQGVGGAMMVPVGRLVVIRTTEKTDLVRAVAYLTWPALVAPLLAPALGGFLSEYASWRWIFLINLPLGVVALLLSFRLVPDVRADNPGPLDLRGFLLGAAGIAALVVGLEGVAESHPDWPLAIGALALAAVALTAVVVHLLRARQPLVDLSILRVRTYRVTALGGSVFRAVITAIPFLLPLFFQIGFGWTAAQAGLVVIALFAGNVGIKPVTTPLMRRLGIRTVMLGAVLASAVCLIGIAYLRPSTPIVALLGLLALSGIFRSIGFTTYNTVAFADVPGSRMTSANTLMSTVQELGGGLGVAVGALLVRLGAGVSVDGAYRFAFLFLAALLIVPAVDAFRLPRDAGNLVAGRAQS